MLGAEERPVGAEESRQAQETVKIISNNFKKLSLGGGVSRHVRDGISRVIAAGGGMSRHGVTEKNNEKHCFDCTRSFRFAFSFSLSLCAGLEISRSRQCVPKTV